ncbi:hypothetical protein [Mycoplasma sp. P36-A1]|uniref:hypothetical protein n=1 Tax=Mycoplasma sp. P36-A1 TaxID=3252900 RepID=UPI003C2BB243
MIKCEVCKNEIVYYNESTIICSKCKMNYDIKYLRAKIENNKKIISISELLNEIIILYKQSRYTACLQKCESVLKLFPKNNQALLYKAKIKLVFSIKNNKADDECLYCIEKAFLSNHTNNFNIKELEDDLNKQILIYFENIGNSFSLRPDNKELVKSSQEMIEYLKKVIELFDQNNIKITRQNYLNGPRIFHNKIIETFNNKILANYTQLKTTPDLIQWKRFNRRIESCIKLLLMLNDFFDYDFDDDIKRYEDIIKLERYSLASIYAKPIISSTNKQYEYQQASFTKKEQSQKIQTIHKYQKIIKDLNSTKKVVHNQEKINKYWNEQSNEKIKNNFLILQNNLQVKEQNHLLIESSYNERIQQLYQEIKVLKGEKKQYNIFKVDERKQLDININELLEMIIELQEECEMKLLNNLNIIKKMRNIKNQYLALTNKIPLYNKNDTF